jgi:serine/threonine-protein kinase
MPKAKAAAERALALDENLGEAHSALGLVHFIYDWDWPAAEREFKRAIELKPSAPETYYYYAIYIRWIHGRDDDAIATARRAITLDPYGAQTSATLGHLLFETGHLREAVTLLEDVIEREPTSWFAYRTLGLIYQAISKYSEAIDVQKKAIALSGRNIHRVIAELGISYALCGRMEEAEILQDELTERSRREYISPTVFGLMANAMGKTDAAWDHFEKAIDERDPTVPACRHWPFLKPLHGHPRFESLVKRIGLP